MFDNNMELKQLLQLTIEASVAAGKKILHVYNTRDFDVEFKADDSPLTTADELAHECIAKRLSKTPYPILSEEGKSIPYSERKNWGTFWLVDPLDGTKEFIKRNGEFTVNIALIENGVPTMGVVYAPYLADLYFGTSKFGAYKVENLAADSETEDLQVDNLMKRGFILPQTCEGRSYTIVGSRSHMNKATEEFINELADKHEHVEFVSKGSSLKLCMIAEGKADIYPRFAPTMEWDTGAGQAIVEAAGYKVLLHESDQPLRYNKEDLTNPWFIAK